MGFPVFKVGDNKLFAILTDDDCECELTVKLTDDERDVAMQLPYVQRASYVGRYGVGDGSCHRRRVAVLGARMAARELADRDKVAAVRIYSSVGGRDEDSVVWDFEYTAR